MAPAIQVDASLGLIPELLLACKISQPRKDDMIQPDAVKLSIKVI